VSGVVSKRMSIKEHLSLAILLHLLEFVLNDDSFIHQRLSILIVGVEQLELDVISKSFQEHIMLPLVCVDFVGGVSG
jgi:hypothetical protein